MWQASTGGGLRSLDRPSIDASSYRLLLLTLPGLSLLLLLLLLPLRLLLMPLNGMSCLLAGERGPLAPGVQVQDGGGLLHRGHAVPRTLGVGDKLADVRAPPLG